MKKITVMALALTLCLGAAANAATVTYRLYLGAFAQGPGTFKLTATASAGDNFGIASYGVQLVDSASVVGGILTYNHDSLRAATSTNTVTSDEGTAGFTLLRSADKNAGAGVDATTISASQDTVLPTPNLIGGWGQTASSLAGKNLTGPAQEGDPWGNIAGAVGGSGEAELARGTYTPASDGGLKFIAQPGATTFANVFTNAGLSATAAASIERFVIIPEPATLALAGVALIGMVGASRRRSA